MVSFFCVLSSCRSKLKPIGLDIIIPNKERQKYTLAIGLLKYKYWIEQYEVTLCELLVKPLEELDVVHINTMWTQRYHQSCPLKSKSTSADQNSQGFPFTWRASCFSGSYNIYDIPITAGLTNVSASTSTLRGQAQRSNYVLCDTEHCNSRIFFNWLPMKIFIN